MAKKVQMWVIVEWP